MEQSKVIDMLETYQGPLSNTHHKKLASKVTKELVARWYIKEQIKRLTGNEIELGIENTDDRISGK